MKWIDGSERDVKGLTGEEFCEKLALDLHGDYDQWLSCADFVQDTAFLIEFDTVLAMEGIWGFLENSIGHYAPNIIRAFRAIGDDSDADILEEICRLAPPDAVRAQFLSECDQEYAISSFASSHNLTQETEEKISALSERLYLYGDSDIWPQLFAYVDGQLSQL